MIANEFFDALPVRQFERGDAGWHERLIGADEAGAGFRFVLSPTMAAAPLVPPARSSVSSQGA